MCWSHHQARSRATYRRGGCQDRSLILQNQLLYLGLLNASLLNLVIKSTLLTFKLFIFASFKTWENETFLYWYIMCNQCFRQRSSMLLSTWVIISPQKSALPSQIEISCCCNTSNSSEIGQPIYLSLLNTHIL